MSDYILNKIDVTKCKNYRKENIHNSCDIGDYTICDGLCHFGAIELFKQLQQSEDRVKELEEQLQRKEQECEELKKQHESDKGLITSTGKMNYQLIQEYDKLKAENDELKKKCNIYTCGICGNKEDCNKLYKTLTEIKEIAEYCYDEVDKENDGFWLILQKISECEVNND